MSIFFLKDKIRSRIDELNKYRFKVIQDLPKWNIMEDSSKMQKYPPHNWENSGFIQINDFWKGRDVYYWVQQTLTVPESRQIYLILDFGDSDNIGSRRKMFHR